jgi:hypothetical protein
MVSSDGSDFADNDVRVRVDWVGESGEAANLVFERVGFVGVIVVELVAAPKELLELEVGLRR